jgi:hypothetical protein
VFDGLRTSIRRIGFPPIREDMVAFYKSYISVALERQPEKIEAAKAALAARDLLLGGIMTKFLD